MKFGPIESIKIHRDGGYGFLLYRKRLGAMSLFEAGEIHTVKNFKIECRRVLNRDNLKTQTPLVGGTNNIKQAQAQPQPAQLKTSAPFNMEFQTINQLVSKEASLLDTTTNTSIKSASKPLKLKGQYFDPNESSINQNDTTKHMSEVNDSMSVYGTENVLGSFIGPGVDPYVNEPEYFYKKILDADDNHAEDCSYPKSTSVLVASQSVAQKHDLKKPVAKPNTNSWLQKIEAEDFDPLDLLSVDNSTLKREELEK